MNESDKIKLASFCVIDDKALDASDKFNVLECLMELYKTAKWREQKEEGSDA